MTALTLSVVEKKEETCYILGHLLLPHMEYIRNPFLRFDGGRKDSHTFLMHVLFMGRANKRGDVQYWVGRVGAASFALNRCCC